MPQTQSPQLLGIRKSRPPAKVRAPKLSAGILGSSEGRLRRIVPPQGGSRNLPWVAPHSRLILKRAGGHPDHLNEPDDCSEDQSTQVQPAGVQPIVEQFSQEETQQHSGWNDESDFGVANHGGPWVTLRGTIVRSIHA